MKSTTSREHIADGCIYLTPSDNRWKQAREIGGGMTARRSRGVRSPWPLLFAIASFGQLLAAAGAPKLVPGVELPVLEVNALSGDAVALPRDARGHAAVLVIGFSKAAAKVSRPWLDGCRSATAAWPAESEIFCYDVRMLEEVPRLFRGQMERAMRKGFPVELQRRTLLVYAENDAWRERVGTDDDKSPYVISMDAEGRVRGAARGQYVETELRTMLEAIGPTAPARD